MRARDRGKKKAPAVIVYNADDKKLAPFFHTDIYIPIQTDMIRMEILVKRAREKKEQQCTPSRV